MKPNGKATNATQEKRYVVRAGGRISKKDVLIVGPILEAIPREERKPSHVVELASKRSSPLHKFFEWNDTKAAQEHRLQQARILLGSIRVVIVSNGKESEPLPEFISVSHVAGQANIEREYVTVTEISKDDDLAERYLARCVSDIVSLSKDYEAVRSFLKGKRSPQAKGLQQFFRVADELAAAQA